MNWPSDEELKVEAKRRYERDARTHPNHRPFFKVEPWDHWYFGLRAERELAMLFHVPMNMELLPSGDGQIDFRRIPVWLDKRVVPANLDVKCFTYQGPGEKMGVEAAIVKPAVLYVHANHNMNSNKTILRGWMLGSKVREYPVGCFAGRDIESHMVPVEHLADMRELLPPRPANNPFFGYCCGCGRPGLYFAREQWFCQVHRMMALRCDERR